MAIILQKAEISLVHRLGIIDTIEVYIDDVLVASASEQSGIAWAVSITETQSFLHGDAFAVIALLPNESLNLAGYLPSIVDGGASGASISVQDVTLYIPGESLDLNVPGSNASIPTVTETLLGQGGSVFGAYTANILNLSASASLVGYIPTVTEGPSGSNPSVTLF